MTARHLTISRLLVVGASLAILTGQAPSKTTGQTSTHALANSAAKPPADKPAPNPVASCNCRVSPCCCQTTLAPCVVLSSPAPTPAPAPVPTPAQTTQSVNLSFCKPPFNLSPGKTPDKLSKLAEACYFENDWQLDKSALSYKDAIDSTDERVRNYALAGYERVTGRLNGVSWTFRRFLPFNSLKESRLLFRLPLIILELALLAFLFGWYAQSTCSRRNAYFAPTDDLSGSAPVKFFAAEMRAALLEIGPILNDQGGRQMTGSGSYSPPEQELQAVGNALPAIPGIDVSKLMTALLTLFRYFGYRVESGLALVDGKACAFATIRQMGKTRGHFEIEEPLPPPPVPPPLSPAIPPVPVTHLASRLAYLVSARLAWR
jgi:hypothetical protein